MLLLSYNRWVKDPSRPSAETDVPKFILDGILTCNHNILLSLTWFNRLQTTVEPFLSTATIKQSPLLNNHSQVYPGHI